MEKEVRNYNIKDVDMLITASTIIESAKENETFLAEKRSTWANPFFNNLATEIDKATTKHLGIDGAGKLRNATQAVMQVQSLVLPMLAEVKIQIIEDFKLTPQLQKEILTALGFQSYHTDAIKGDQEALVNLLYSFKTNIATHEDKLIEKGIAKTTIESITNFADKLKNSNIYQENQKGQRKEITAEAIKDFNNIYSNIVSICRIASKFFKDNPALKEQFSFAKVSKNLNKKPKK